MDIKTLVKFIEQKKFQDKDINLIQQEIQKYPYFSTLKVVYLMALKATDNIEFSSELTKYAIHIRDRSRLIELLIDTEEAKSKPVDISKLDEQELEKELYQAAKRRHEEIIKEIIEPKVERLRELSEIAKKVKEKEKQKQPPAEEKTAVKEQVKQEPKIEVKSETKLEVKPEAKPQPEPTKKEPEKTEPQQTTQPPVDLLDISVDEKTEITEKPKPEPKTQPEPPKKEPEKAETQQTTELTQAEKDKQTVSDIDDIFRKIEELKKQKLKSTSAFTKRMATVESMIKSTPVREDITEEVKQKTPPEKPKVSKPETVEKAPEQPTAEPETKTTTQQPQITEQTQPATTEVKKPETKPEPEQKPETTQKAEPQTKIETSKEKIATETTETQPVIKETTTTTTTTTAKKKSAADRILEQIAKRRELRRKKEQEIIDNFLKTNPTIDRNKEPSLKGDLSEPSTKEIEVITEQMARIYELQGLYDKAISVYEKLILQKPEKKDYFAQKIQELKQKLNK